MSTNQISVTGEGTLDVPDRPIIPFIEGDGIGPDVFGAAKKVVDAGVQKVYGDNREIIWKEILAGEKSFRKNGHWLAEETIEAIKRNIVAVKGPLTTPVGEGIRSINVSLRQSLDLYANIRPIKYIGSVPSPMKAPQLVNMIIFRENTEDVYAGIEWEAHSKDARDIISIILEKTGRELPSDSGIGIKPISAAKSKRLVSMAIKFAIENNFPSVTLMHKGNIMKYTEGAFLRWGYEVAKEKFFDRTITEKELYEKHGGNCPNGKVVIKDRIADNMFKEVLLKPQEYHVIATTNLNGDYLSDAVAAQAGGLGMAPGANIGDKCAVFEAVHGTAPKYAGKDTANPGSLILSCAMMLDYIGWKEAAIMVKESIIKTIGKRIVTRDLAVQMKGAKRVSCSSFADEIVKTMQQQ